MAGKSSKKRVKGTDLITLSRDKKEEAERKKKSKLMSPEEVDELGKKNGGSK